MNAKLSPHRLWPCHENRLIKNNSNDPHNLYVSFKLTSHYCELRIILDYPDPQQREADLKLRYRVPFESSLWARFHGRAKTYKDRVWYSSKIGELWPSVTGQWVVHHSVFNLTLLATWNDTQISTKMRGKKEVEKDREHPPVKNKLTLGNKWPWVAIESSQSGVNVFPLWSLSPLSVFIQTGEFIDLALESIRHRSADLGGVICLDGLLVVCVQCPNSVAEAQHFWSLT